MAQGTYTVNTEAVQGRTYENKKGPGNLVVWRLGLKDAVPDTPDNLFELHKKETSDPPKVGDTIEVERFSPGEFSGEKFVRIYEVYGGGKRGGRGGSSGGSSSRSDDDGPGLEWKSAPYEKGAEHPRNEKRQIHTSCLSSAPAYYTLLREEGMIPKPEDKAAALKTLLGIVAWLEGTYRLDRPNVQTEIPVDANGLGEPSGAVPVDVPFS